MDSSNNDIKNKVVSGMLWTGFEKLGAQLIQFVVGIIIARKLLPEDYGLIGMLTIFISIAQIFIDSGFANALIQKKDRNPDDYSTVFYFSIISGILIYLLLYLVAPLIASFYNQPILTAITRIYTISLVINSLIISQTALLNVELKFKIQAIISIVSICISGIIGVILAYSNWGVWALVYQGLTMAIIRTILIWIASKWKPLLLFSKRSFKLLFSFGSKLLFSSLIGTIYNNISTIIIGKAFNATDLGLFTRANQFGQLPTQIIENIVTKVNYPILTRYQDDDKLLVNAYKNLLRTPMYILYPILFGIAVLNKPLIQILLGDKWLGACLYIPILCFGYLWGPLSGINLNLLYVKGLSNIVLKLEFIKKPIGFVMLFAAIPFGMTGICVSIALYYFIAFAFNCYYTGKYLNFGFFKQIKSLIPIIRYCIIMSIGIVITLLFIRITILQLIIGTLTGLLIYFLLSYGCNDISFLIIKDVIFSKLNLKKLN